MPSASDTGNPDISNTNGVQNQTEAGAGSTSANLNSPVRPTTGKLGLRSLKAQTKNGASAAANLSSEDTKAAASGESVSLADLLPNLEMPDSNPPGAPISLAGLIPDLESPAKGEGSEEGVSLAGLLSDFEPSNDSSDSAGSISLAGLIPDLETSPAKPVETALPRIEPSVETKAQVALPPETISNAVSTPDPAPIAASPATEPETPKAKPVESAAQTAPQEIVAPPSYQPRPAKKEEPSTALASTAQEVDRLEKAEKDTGKRTSKKLKKALEADYDRVKLDYQFHRIVQQLEVLPSMEAPLLIGITSTLRGEGRTTIAMGLASAISQEIPLPVVLLETDLTNPSLAEDLSIPNRGLSEYLRGELELDDLTQSTALPDMAVIVAGDCKGQALRILRSERLSNLVSILSQQFAAIIVDLPPMSMTGEAARVISQLDRVLMVVEAGSTPNKLVRTALELIPEDKMAGVLLNRTRPAFGFFQWVKRLFR